jgi:hypothetical protein
MHGLLIISSSHYFLAIDFHYAAIIFAGCLRRFRLLMPLAFIDELLIAIIRHYAISPLS